MNIDNKSLVMFAALGPSKFLAYSLVNKVMGGGGESKPSGAGQSTSAPSTAGTPQAPSASPTDPSNTFSQSGVGDSSPIGGGSTSAQATLSSAAA